MTIRRIYRAFISSSPEVSRTALGFSVALVVTAVTAMALIFLPAAPSYAETTEDVALLKARADAALLHLADEDVAFGVASLGAVVLGDVDHQLAGYRSILANWSHYLTPLDEVVEEVPENTLIKWRGRDYFKDSSSALKILPEGEMLAASLDHEKRHLVIIQQRQFPADSHDDAYENVLELYDLKDFSVKARHVIPINVGQIIQPQWQDFVLLIGSQESSSAGGLVDELYSLNLETGQLSATEATRFVFDSQCTSVLWENWRDSTASVIAFDKLNEGRVSPQQFDVVNLRPAISKARGKIAQGENRQEAEAHLDDYIKSILRENPQALFQTRAYDFVDMKIESSGLVEQRSWSAASESCGQFVLDEMANEPFDEGGSEHNSFYDFKFPFLRELYELWAVGTEDQLTSRLLTVEDKETGSLSLKDMATLFEWSEKEEQWGLREWSEIEQYTTVPEWAGRLPKPARIDLYESSFLFWNPSEWLRSKIDWLNKDPYIEYQYIRDVSIDGDYLNVIFAGGGGAQYGSLSICRLRADELADENSVNHSCFQMEYHGNYGRMRFSEAKDYLYVQNLQYMGFNSFDLIDLRDNEKIALSRTPFGEGPSPEFVAFNHDSTTLVVFNGDFWVYKRLPNSRKFAFLHVYSYSDILVPCYEEGCGVSGKQALVDGVTFIGDNLLLVVRRDGQMMAIDAITGGLLWTAQDGMSGSGKKQIIQSASSDLFVVYNRDGLRVFMKSNTAPLSRFLKFTDFVLDKKLDGPIDSEKVDFSLETGNRVEFGIDDQYWSRDFDLNDDPGVDGLDFKSMTGFESDGHGGIRPMQRL